MAVSRPLSLLLLTALLFLLSAALSKAQIDAQSLNWPSTISVDNADFAIFDDDEQDANQTSETDDRRSLYWTAARHYYISYGALSANRIPCPARSGRSYYTHNCYTASGPVRPYSRGCSAITRCRI
ncbi:hypothetical protein Vadar_009882 [Vaccinium darrowii]|uniref:Uncharacterized protein n=1 Tax=Vaccinium darrowii TaxID=229202 RepID=A0ACB7Y603_9ERIC|nr:hypothetical protein Vadar_009882 [Vaccinium darrowii]